MIGRHFVNVARVAVLAFAAAAAAAHGGVTVVTPLEALSGLRGYGADGACIQDPGAQAGAYAFAGLAMPYDGGDDYVLPDSLQPLCVAYVGCPASGFPSDTAYIRNLRRYLEGAGPLTPVGERVLRLCAAMDSISKGRLGMLGEIGRRDVAGIGGRLALNYKRMLSCDNSVHAISSSDVASLATAQGLQQAMALVSDSLSFSLAASPERSHFQLTGESAGDFAAYCDTVAPLAAALRLTVSGSKQIQHIGRIYSGAPDSGAALEEFIYRKLSRSTEVGRAQVVAVVGWLYRLVAEAEGLERELSEAGVASDWRLFFTTAEYSTAWQCENRRSLLLSRSAEVRGEAARINKEVREEFEGAIEGNTAAAVTIRMVSPEVLLALAGATSKTQDWEMAPRGGNLQLTLCRTPSGSTIIVRRLNELPE